MNILFLRGRVPIDRNPEEIKFNTIKECDDIWTMLAYRLTNNKSTGKVIVSYWGGNDRKYYGDNFGVEYLPNFQNYTPSVRPDIIFARGGFREYHAILSRFPNAFKIYYGAGTRYKPQSGFHNYNLILVDSPEQKAKIESRYPDIYCNYIIKPAPDNIMHPNHKVQKTFDVCFPANGSQASFKGHHFIYSTVPKYLKVLNLGNSSRLERPGNIVQKRVFRKDMAREYSRCKIGVVACEKGIDSCPRVIPEMLACNLPIVVVKGVNIWASRYVNDQTGILTDKKNFWDAVNYVLMHRDEYKPRKYYNTYLDMNCAVNHLKQCIYLASKERIKL